MSWTAVVPLKGHGERKTRLASRLDSGERHRLSEVMFAHVVAVLRACAEISEIALLSDRRPDDWSGHFFPDAGRGLNVELSAMAGCVVRPLLVIHADIPLVSVDDIAALLSEAERGVAIAPDRHGIGTNAVAVRTAVGDFRFAFGPNSLERHIEGASGRPRIVRRTGLAIDIDTADDYDAALAFGYRG